VTGATIARQKPMDQNPEAFILLCGKRNGDGRQTCPGAFGDVTAGGVWIYAIMGEIRPGVFDLSNHAKKQRAAGQVPSLRRHLLRHSGDTTRPFGAVPPSVDLGSMGQDGGGTRITGAAVVICPVCRHPNTIPAAWFK
jgi:hypothetical protein